MARLRTVAGLIFIAAVAVRLAIVFALDLYHTPMRGELQCTALSLATTGVYGNPYSLPTGPSAHSAPLYTILLAAVYYWFGTGYGGELAIYIIDILIASIQYALLPVWCRAAGLPTRAGMLAGAFGALVPYHYLNEARAGDAALTGLALMGLTILALRSAQQENPTAGSAVVSGVLWGAGLLLNSAVLPVFFGYAAVTAYRTRGRALRLYLPIAAAAAGLLLLPWAIRNYLQLGSAIFLRSNFGIEFRLSNNDVAKPDIDRNRVGGSFDQFHPFVSREAALRVREEGEVAYSRRLLNEALIWVKTHPRSFLRLTALRAVYFWFPKTLKPVQSVLLSTLTLAGLLGFYFLYRDRRIVGLFLAVLWLTFPLVHYLVQSAVRYRYPLNWTFLLLGSVAILTVVENLRRGRRPS